MAVPLARHRPTSTSSASTTEPGAALAWRVGLTGAARYASAMQKELEPTRARPPVVRKAAAGLILVVAAALVVWGLIGVIKAIFWTVVVIAVVVAVLWALKTILW
jgi:hypothetical protein